MSRKSNQKTEKIKDIRENYIKKHYLIYIN